MSQERLHRGMPLVLLFLAATCRGQYCAAGRHSCGRESVMVQQYVDNSKANFVTPGHGADGVANGIALASVPEDTAVPLRQSVAIEELAQRKRDTQLLGRISFSPLSFVVIMLFALTLFFCIFGISQVLTEGADEIRDAFAWALGYKETPRSEKHSLYTAQESLSVGAPSSKGSSIVGGSAALLAGMPSMPGYGETQRFEKPGLYAAPESFDVRAPSSKGSSVGGSAALLAGMPSTPGWGTPQIPIRPSPAQRRGSYSVSTGSASVSTPPASSSQLMSGGGREATMLCEELQVPEGAECVLAVPSFAKLPGTPDTFHSVAIRDPTGDPVLCVSMRMVQEGLQEQLTLSSWKDTMYVATCVVNLGPSLAPGQPRCSVYRAGGELHARLDDLPGRGTSTPESFGQRSSDRAFVVTQVSTSGVSLPLWHVSVSIDGSGRQETFIRKGSGASHSEPIAVMGSGEFGFDPDGLDYDQLRAMELVDMSLVLLVCVAIGRSLANETR